MSLKKEELIFTSIEAAGEKQCSRCGNILPYSSFYRNKSKKDGVESYCKQCAKHRNLLKRIKNKKEDPFSGDYTVVFNGFPDEKLFVQKLETLIEEVLDQ